MNTEELKSALELRTGLNWRRQQIAETLARVMQTAEYLEEPVFTKAVLAFVAAGEDLIAREIGGKPEEKAPETLPEPEPKPVRVREKGTIKTFDARENHKGQWEILNGRQLIGTYSRNDFEESYEFCNPTPEL